MKEFDKQNFKRFLLLLIIFYPIHFIIIGLFQNIYTMILLILCYMPLIILCAMVVGNELGNYLNKDNGFVGEAEH